MARANAAGGSAHAGTLQGLARALTQPGHLRMAEYEPWLRRLVPLLVAVFMTVLAVGAVIQCRDARDRAVGDAVGDMEMVAALAAGQLDAALAHQPNLKPMEALGRLLPGRALTGGRQILVSDLSGRVVAAVPPLGARGRLLSDLLGAAQPLTVFADKPGVMRIDLADGEDVLAAVRQLDAPYGQIAVIHPVSDLLSDWRSASFRSGFLLFSTAFVLIVIALAYFWQTDRAVEVEAIHARVHGRIDTALNRGPLRPVGLGPRARPHLLVRLHVRDARHAGAGRIHVLRRGSTSWCTRATETCRGWPRWWRRRGRARSTMCSACATATAPTCGSAPGPSSCGEGGDSELHLVGIAGRHLGREAHGRAQRHRRRAPARRHRGHLGSLRAVGRRQPAGHLQLEVPRPSRAEAPTPSGWACPMRRWSPTPRRR